MNYLCGMYYIIGQGLAGTALALTFLENEIPFRIFDDGHLSSSSTVAAGMWNPIVFRRVNKSWMADDLIPELEEFYPQWEERLKSSFYHSKPIWRIHTTKQELDIWFEKRTLPGFQPYLFNPRERFEEIFGKNCPYGEGEVRHAGYLDLPSFLSSARRHFEALNLFHHESLPETFDPENFFSNNLPRGIVIDARGYRSGLSALWDYLPWGLTKGEVLTLECFDLQEERIFNSGFFLLPLGNHTFRLGATFNWDELDEEPTKAKREELLSKFEKFFDAPYRVLDHKAGIRPTVQDRKPLMGKHPKMENLFLFNGLGTKGVMLAPFLARHFTDYLVRNERLMKEVDISRFDRLWGEKHPQINHPQG